MAHSKNAWLEQFEVKKPDYDYIERDYVGMEDASFPPARYVKKGDAWVPKKITNRLFSKKKNARLMFVGDITCFEKQFEEARNGRDYDFSFEFDKVRPIFAQADLVVGNLETMIFPDAPYRTEKYVSEQNFHCNAPIEFLDAIRKAGFDVLTNANNHDMDTGAVGIGETIDRVEKFGFIQTGTFKSDQKKRYEIITVEGFKIAIVAFATEHNNKRCNLTEEGVEFLLNDYGREKAERIIKDARADGAELVFVCIHWGKENKIINNSEQEAIAEELVELGYDCIIGSHPHVLQPFTKMYDENAKEVPVFYSMGNFVSHNANNQKARSVIAVIDIVRTGKRVDLEASYIPIFTSNNYGPKKYVVLPINAHALDPRNNRKKQQIAEIMGEEISLTTGVSYHECIEKPDLPAMGKKDQKPNLAKVKEFPVAYDDGKFVFDVEKKSATLTGISPGCATSSYSVPSKVLGLPVSSLAPGAFAGNPNMKKINFSKSLSAISEGACRNCLVLEGFQLGSQITKIEAEAFAGCVSLSAITMRTKVQTIESGAFRGCTALRSVKIPPNVTKIADDAFEGCTRAVFYCEEGSYAQQYAAAHGFTVVNMKLD